MSLKRRKSIVSLTSAKDTFTFLLYHRFRYVRAQKNSYSFTRIFISETPISHSKPISHHLLFNFFQVNDSLQKWYCVTQKTVLLQPSCRKNREHKVLGHWWRQTCGRWSESRPSPVANYAGNRVGTLLDDKTDFAVFVVAHNRVIDIRTCSDQKEMK